MYLPYTIAAITEYRQLPPQPQSTSVNWGWTGLELFKTEVAGAPGEDGGMTGPASRWCSWTARSWSDSDEVELGTTVCATERWERSVAGGVKRAHGTGLRVRRFMLFDTGRGGKSSILGANTGGTPGAETVGTDMKRLWALPLRLALGLDERLHQRTANDELNESVTERTCWNAGFSSGEENSSTESEDGIALGGTPRELRALRLIFNWLVGLVTGLYDPLSSKGK